MTDFMTEWKTMPDEELRKIYLHRLRLQKFLAWIPVALIVPAMIMYGFLGWLTTIVALGFHFIDTSVLGFLDFVAFAVCGVIYTTRNPKTLKFIPLIMLMHIILKLLITRTFTIISVVFLIYTAFASFFLRQIVSELEYMRTFPNFPFTKTKKEIALNGMTHDQMLKYMEREANGGVSSVGYDEIFTSDDPEKIVTPPEKTEEYFQQHKVMYDGLNYSKDLKKLTGDKKLIR